ncbi:MAG: FecR domain-containing protein [Cyclobacteriaceae bacterium]|nr:FecR domain-containing protein [Cyclobacteriaceae bacterium]
MKDNQSNPFDNLIAKSLANETSVEEEKQLRDWISEDSDNEHYFEDYHKTLTLVDSHYPKDKSQNIPIDIDKEWTHFVNVIENRKTKVIPLESSNKSVQWLKIAAVISFIIISTFAINYLFINPSAIEHQTAGLVQEIILPDGSIITLNKNSTITYTKKYGENDRSVHLNGEAFFDVKPNKEKPFIIHTKRTDIKVLGTSFNVETSNNRATKVIVATGVVQFSSNDTDQKVTLNAGDIGVLSKTPNGKIMSTTNNDVNYLAWKTHKLIFEEDNLSDVIETLNKVYSANISIAPSLSNSCQVTVTFDQQSLKSILNVLKTTLNLSIKSEKGKIEIIKTGC